MKKKRTNQKQGAKLQMKTRVPTASEVRTTIQKQVSLSRSGPLPIPSELRGYGEIDPGYPERIIRMAEKQLELKEYEIIRAKDNEAMEIKGRNDMIAGVNKNTQTKIWTDFTIVLIALGAMIAAYFLSKDIGGSIVIALTIAFLQVFGKLFSAYFSNKNKDEK